MGESIPGTRRADAIYCRNNCGSTFRNKRNARERMKLQEREPGLYSNYKVIKNLVHMGILDFTIETAKSSGWISTFIWELLILIRKKKPLNSGYSNILTLFMGNN